MGSAGAARRHDGPPNLADAPLPGALLPPSPVLRNRNSDAEARGGYGGDTFRRGSARFRKVFCGFPREVPQVPQHPFR
jgi:hypothetical protein